MTHTKYAILLVSVLILAGCGPNIEVKPNDPVIVPTKQTVVIPREQLEDCDPLTKPDARAFQEDEIPVLVNIWRAIHSDCMKGKHALIETVKKAFNITSPDSVPSPVNNTSINQTNTK